jgi:hypothetical protein
MENVHNKTERMVPPTRSGLFLNGNQNKRNFTHFLKPSCLSIMLMKNRRYNGKELKNREYKKTALKF